MSVTPVGEVMNHPPTPSKDRELTFEQTKEIDKFLEGYNCNPSNSNKWRYALHAHIEKLLTEQADSLKQSLVAEMPKKKKQTIEDRFIQDNLQAMRIDGYNQAAIEANQAINKVFNGRM